MSDPARDQPNPRQTPARQGLEQARRVLLLTTDDDDPSFAAARQAMADLSRRTGAEVVLYDRSGETWGDTPHPSGPLPADDPLLDDRPHLRRQLEELGDRGVTASAWMSTLPSSSATTTPVLELDIDAVVVPMGMDRSLADRLIPGSDMASTVQHVLDVNLPQNVLVVAVDEHGHVVGADEG
jgi:hypothetical protein